MVLEEAFKQRWGVTAVASPPPAAPMYASARPAAFVLCHQLAGRGDTLASLAVRHGTDVVELKRLNNLMSDGALASRCAGAEAWAPCKGCQLALARAHATLPWRGFTTTTTQKGSLPE